MLKEKKQDIMKEYGVHENDSGSAFVQIALLSEKISLLSEHVKNNAKDFSARNRLWHSVARRRRFIKYITKNGRLDYSEFFAKLGIRVKHN